MKALRALLLVCAFLACPPARAHIGSPDIFYDGPIGRWTAHVTIRMPTVVPGQAQIFVQLHTNEPVEVFFVPLASKVAASNSPPAEKAVCTDRAANVYSGELWLMTVGAYSVQVQIHTASGDGMVEIPVASVASSQLALPPSLGGILIFLGIILFIGAIAIVAAAAGESSVPTGAEPDAAARRKYRIAGAVTAVVLASGLFGGWKWWGAEEKDFRTRLHEGGWPDVAATIETNQSQRLLRLKFSDRQAGGGTRSDLITDHGKWLHLYLVGQAEPHVFAHLHPQPQGDGTFITSVPPLPEGAYEIFCDLTFSAGFSSTATNIIHLPPVFATKGEPQISSATRDADDSWTLPNQVAAAENSHGETLNRVPGGDKIIWKSHGPLRANQDAGLVFEVRDANDRPRRLQSYMGMMSHAAVVRSDGKVFSHLHPSGNFSMASQDFFVNKAAAAAKKILALNDHKRSTEEWCGPVPAGGGSSTISLPYEFPSPGKYTIWVQIKTEGQIKTAAFEASVD